MADTVPNSLEYVTTCQVCFNDYEETGERVPRMLPCQCHYTLCEKCLGEILQNNTVVCPECRERCPVEGEKGAKIFPQNKVVLPILRRRGRDSEAEVRADTPSQKQEEKCEVHGKTVTMYCLAADCKKPICNYCHKEDHKDHEWEDLEDVKKEQCMTLRSNIETLNKDLKLNKTRFIETKEITDKKMEDYVENLRNLKDEKVKIFAEMIEARFAFLEEKVLEKRKAVNIKIDADIAKIDEFLFLLNNTMGNIEPEDCRQEDIANDLRKVWKLSLEAVDFVHKSGTYKTFEYTEGDVSREEIKRLCGELTQKEVAVDKSPMQALHAFNPKVVRTIKTQYQGAVYGLCLLAGKFAVLNTTSSEGPYSMLTKYDLETGEEVCRVDLPRISRGVAITQLSEATCVAVSYHQTKQIEFRHADDPSQVLLIHSVAPQVPGRLTAFSDTTLLYTDGSNQPFAIHWLDCSKTPPEPLDGKKVIHPQENFNDICCVQDEEDELVIASVNEKGLRAYNIESNDLQWSVEGKLTGMESDMNGLSVTKKSRRRLFVGDGNNGCIQIFSSNGAYLGVLATQAELGIEPNVYFFIRWCSQRSSLIVAHNTDGGNANVIVMDVK